MIFAVAYSKTYIDAEAGKSVETVVLDFYNAESIEAAVGMAMLAHNGNGKVGAWRAMPVPEEPMTTEREAEQAALRG